MESTTASSSYEEEYLEPTSNGEKILVNNLLLKMIVHHHREVRVRQTFVPSSDTTTKRSRITTSEHTESHNQPRPQTSPHTYRTAPQPTSSSRSSYNQPPGTTWDQECHRRAQTAPSAVPLQQQRAIPQTAKTKAVSKLLAMLQLHTSPATRRRPTIMD